MVTRIMPTWVPGAASVGVSCPTPIHTVDTSTINATTTEVPIRIVDTSPGDIWTGRTRG
jgi:hypothetical protein